MEQSKDYILEMVNKYNHLMNDAIIGPNCIDPSICHADCCHIKIDIPRLLAEFYIENGYAKKEDFSRGDLFSFKINVNSTNSKCVFYDKGLNGCSLHKTMYKPPQCWIYPTGFTNDPGEEKTFAEDGTIKCKIAAGWRITDIKKTKGAKILFDEYVAFCEKEFTSETTTEKIKNRLEELFNSLKNCSPKSVAGVMDGWDQFTILKSEGISLKLKSLCDQISKQMCDCEYMECEHICNEIIDSLRRDLLKEISDFIKSKGPKSSYSFLELWNSR
jgi:Fe-S-cluster containining protein